MQIQQVIVATNHLRLFLNFINFNNFRISVDEIIGCFVSGDKRGEVDGQVG